MGFDVRGKRLDGHAVLLSQRGKVTFMRRIDVNAGFVSHCYLTNEISRTRPAIQIPTAKTFSIIWSLTGLVVVRTRLQTNTVSPRTILTATSDPAKIPPKAPRNAIPALRTCILVMVVEDRLGNHVGKYFLEATTNRAAMPAADNATVCGMPALKMCGISSRLAARVTNPRSSSHDSGASVIYELIQVRAGFRDRRSRYSTRPMATRKNARQDVAISGICTLD